jgi:hypothetical protein
MATLELKNPQGDTGSSNADQAGDQLTEITTPPTPTPAEQLFDLLPLLRDIKQAASEILYSSPDTSDTIWRRADEVQRAIDKVVDRLYQQDADWSVFH